jgi:hypothetical protein
MRLVIPIVLFPQDRLDSPTFSIYWHSNYLTYHPLQQEILSYTNFPLVSVIFSIYFTNLHSLPRIEFPFLYGTPWVPAFFKPS